MKIDRSTFQIAILSVLLTCLLVVFAVLVIRDERATNTCLELGYAEALHNKYCVSYGNKPRILRIEVDK